MGKKKKSPIVIPDDTKRVLLHTCCAPCASAIIDWMKEHELRPVVYYCNPNIFPQEEYEKRKEECVRYAEQLGLEFVEAPYDHEAWRRSVKGLEKEPERGKRCEKCFEYRLKQAAKYAAENKIDTITTALASSRWKSLEQVEAAGMGAAEEWEGVKYWAQNWRKGGLSDRRREIIQSYDFYNQQYCGCEFSLAQMKAWRAQKAKEEEEMKGKEEETTI